MWFYIKSRINSRVFWILNVCKHSQSLYESDWETKRGIESTYMDGFLESFSY